MQNVRFMECETNDTWARDHGAITMLDSEGASLLDFMFNGWGLKFASDKDNLITRQAVEAGFLNGRYVNRLGFVLEGGSIESDGLGTLLTTSEMCIRERIGAIRWCFHCFAGGAIHHLKK